MSLTFTATIIAILALLMGTVSISAWKGTLTVLPLVVLIPGLSVLVAVLSLTPIHRRYDYVGVLKG